MIFLKKIYVHAWTSYLEKTHNSKRYMHPGVHYSTIYNSQNLEATQMSINRGMDKKDVVRICNRILLSHKKKKEIIPCAVNMGGPRDSHTK